MSSKVLLMESYFDFLYAKALSEVLQTVVKEQCHGCEIDHPSQVQHSCVMYEEDDHVIMYFHDMLKKIDEQSIISVWCDLMNQLDISFELVDLQKQKICCKDWLQTMKTSKWEEKIKETILTIIRYERRLF